MIYTVLQDPRRSEGEEVVGKLDVDDNGVVKVLDKGQLWGSFIDDSQLESFDRLSAHYPYIYKKETDSDDK